MATGSAGELSIAALRVRSHHLSQVLGLESGDRPWRLGGMTGR